MRGGDRRVRPEVRGRGERGALPGTVIAGRLGAEPSASPQLRDEGGGGLVGAALAGAAHEHGAGGAGELAALDPVAELVARPDLLELGDRPVGLGRIHP